MEEDLIRDREKTKNDSMLENSLRPTSLDDFIGQEEAKGNLRVFIESAKIRSSSLDHILLYGPPGIGKTTLSQIVANEMEVNFKSTSGPILSKAGDLAAILTNLQPNDVLFIDEIHRLHSAVEEILYSAMEDFRLDIIIGEGPGARSIKISLPKFTLVAATTRIGLISNPLKDRFGIPLKLGFYEPEELAKIIERDSSILNIKISSEGAREISKRSRGTARIAIRLLRRIRDFAIVARKNSIDEEIVSVALEKLHIDRRGLDVSDLGYLNFIANNYHGGPVGIDTISAGLSEERDSIEDVIEPYLIQCGFINKTPRGRMLTETAYRYLGIEPRCAVDSRDRDVVGTLGNLWENEDENETI
ncbi:MAG: Holliday junction branch migration DNA helicase RuvB [Rickettsiales bacterium]|jgi:Holliday junction DNA helicase RuvB|nr:Holliday junction branch migration DNA helicase RuvB [Rickettsiales bacterium]